VCVCVGLTTLHSHRVCVEVAARGDARAEKEYGDGVGVEHAVAVGRERVAIDVEQFKIDQNPPARRTRLEEAKREQHAPRSCQQQRCRGVGQSRRGLGRRRKVECNEAARHRRLAEGRPQHEPAGRAADARQRAVDEELERAAAERDEACGRKV